MGDGFNHNRALAAFSHATDSTGLFLAEIWPFLGRQSELGSSNVPRDAISAMMAFGTPETNSMMKSLPFIPTGVPVLRRAFISDHEYYASSMYKQTSEPWGLHSDGVSIFKKGLVHAIACGFMRHPNQGGLDSDILSRIAFLNKHYIRAMGLQNRLSKLEEVLIHSNSALDLVDFGVILYGPNKTPNYMNQAAKRIFSDNDGLTLHGGRLVINDRNANRQFNDMIEALQEDNLPIELQSGGLVRAKRASLKRSYSIMLVPLSTRQSVAGKNTTLAALIFDPNIKRTTAIKLFATSYGFTKAEARLALELAQGTTIEEYASKNKISKNTVRTQIRSLLLKTKTNRQGELVSLLLRVIAGINLE
ncbi:helix-turn-helix transcriptional regulator [Lentilitoribacter sp. Alg239-R112]|uniref:helix-turn-helix transcriptional regulator n=1 Tax=Lentilitoribacter sp. Alg239-R112 TaxID=2305987 RepID=UPI0013A6E1E6|nr:helix-turn-helix transcriptional regulator [Lentilitoribacter sp. Alg239-R112]